LGLILDECARFCNTFDLRRHRISTDSSGLDSLGLAVCRRGKPVHKSGAAMFVSLRFRSSGVAFRNLVKFSDVCRRHPGPPRDIRPAQSGLGKPSRGMTYSDGTQKAAPFAHVWPTLCPDAVAGIALPGRRSLATLRPCSPSSFSKALGRNWGYPAGQGIGNSGKDG